MNNINASVFAFEVTSITSTEYVQTIYRLIIGGTGCDILEFGFKFCACIC